MVAYSTNWMGPLNRVWIEQHGTQWASGRIDVYDVPDEPFGLEYGLAPMHYEDWDSLTDWLEHFETPELWTCDEVLDAFERACLGREIRWYSTETRG